MGINITTWLGCLHVRRFRIMPLLMIVLNIVTIIIPIGRVSAQQHPNNTPLPWIGSTSIVPLTKEKFELISFCGILSEAIYVPGINVTLGFGEKCYSNPVIPTGATLDKYCTLDKDSYCFVYFKGSESPALSKEAFNDWIVQNANAQKQYVTKVDDPNVGCMVHKGFYLNYKGPGLKPMEDFVKTCMANGNYKQLVFTGHSQGAGSAGVAAVAFASYNPLMIGLATPAFLTEPTCPLLAPKRIWRIINTENSKQHALQYDPVCFADILIKALIPETGSSNTFHIGESILLPPNNELDPIPNPPVPQILYRSRFKPDPYGPPTALDILPDRDNGTFLSVHSVLSYNPKLLFILDNTTVSSNPLNVVGFVDDTQCQANFECRSYYYYNNTTTNSNQTVDGGCILNRCSAKRQSIGQKCKSSNDCSTRNCKPKHSKSGQKIMRRCVPQRKGRILQ